MDLSGLSDEELLGRVEAFSETERFSLTDLLAHLGELDTRDACRRKGYAPVFAYLTMPSSIAPGNVGGFNRRSRRDA